MSLGRITIHKHKDYEFVCWSWETSNAWGHEVRLVQVGESGGYELGRARVRYYNRTWERYTFQSAMYSALEDYKKHELEKRLRDYKYEHKLKGYNSETHTEYEKPFPRGVKKQLIEEFNSEPLWKELELYVENGA